MARDVDNSPDTVPGQPVNYVRWPGLLSLALGLTLGPVAALLNEELIYVSDMWACGRGTRWPVNLVPLLCLVITLGMTVVAHRNWKRVGEGVEEEAATIDARTRFLSIAGIFISAFSTLVILAQWAALLAFEPCMRL